MKFRGLLRGFLKFNTNWEGSTRATTTTQISLPPVFAVVPSYSSFKFSTSSSRESGKPLIWYSSDPLSQVFCFGVNWKIVRELISLSTYVLSVCTVAHQYQLMILCWPCSWFFFIENEKSKDVFELSPFTGIQTVKCKLWIMLLFYSNRLNPLIEILHFHFILSFKTFAVKSLI